MKVKKETKLIEGTRPGSDIKRKKKLAGVLKGDLIQCQHVKKREFREFEEAREKRNRLEQRRKKKFTRGRRLEI